MKSCVVPLVMLAIGCTASRAAGPDLSDAKPLSIQAAHFESMDGCAIVYDTQAQRIVASYGEERCRKRYAACSTFKWPLALMAFDAGVLQDENTPMKWDGVPRAIESWNQDHTAASWMRNSVVWYSQRITPQFGTAKLQSYLKAFDYGNQDISAGLTSAWLTITKTESDPGRGSLKISAYEQLEFIRKFWANELPVSAQAMEKTKRVLFLETSPAGYSLHGKTGSGYVDGLDGDFGWFIGRVEGQGKEYLAVTTFTRTGRAADARYPGMLAKEITKEILKENGIW